MLFERTFQAVRSAVRSFLDMPFILASHLMRTAVPMLSTKQAVKDEHLRIAV
jgi:hypothetical protein